jgi:hypothetical protein
MRNKLTNFLLKKFCFFLLFTTIFALSFSQASGEENLGSAIFKDSPAPQREISNNEEKKQESKEKNKPTGKSFVEEEAKEKNGKKEEVIQITGNETKVIWGIENDVLDVKINENPLDECLKETVEKELEGSKMEPMIEYILKYDQKTIAFLVGVAKAESGYNHSLPQSYNFWGYGGGYIYFNDEKEAVKKVAETLEKRYIQRGYDTPGELVHPWKCGANCAVAGHSATSVNRWIGNVTGPYKRIMECNKNDKDDDDQKNDN